jgi:hypothetical protein
MATEDQLEEIYQAFVLAKEARDAAMEKHNDAMQDLRSANARFDRAIENLAEYLGTSMTDEGGDAGDIFTTLTGGLSFKPLGKSNPFGDLF